jgi:DNA repair protein RadC
MNYAIENDEGTQDDEAAARARLTCFERSPRLSELKVAYRSRTKFRDRTPIRGPRDAVEYLRAVWNRQTLELVEEFMMVCLNGNHQVIGWVKVATGGFSGAPVDPRVVFGIALQTASTAIVLAHNHPSGSPEPSEADRRVTDRLREAGRMLGVAVLDHIILTRDAAFSFTESRLL